MGRSSASMVANTAGHSGGIPGRRGPASNSQIRTSGRLSSCLARPAPSSSSGSATWGWSAGKHSGSRATTLTVGGESRTRTPFAVTPKAHVSVPEGMLVSTTRSVERLPPVGEPVVLYDAGRLHLRAPLSVAVATTGEIAVGMQHFVLVLRPGADGYAARWYVPFPCGVEPPSSYASAHD